MAREFKVLFVLWLAAACHVSGQTTDSSSDTGAPSVDPSIQPTEIPSTTTPLPSVDSSTTPSVEPSIQPTEIPSTTTPLPSVDSATTPSVDPDTTPSPSETTGAPSVDPDTTPSPSETTGAPSVNPTTQSSLSTSTVLATTKPQNPCDGNPCGQGSTCEPRANQTFVCLCLAGNFFNTETQSCERAKVFPGQLQLSNLEYKKEMEDNRSPEFLEAAEEIKAELHNAFSGSDNGFSGSIVLKLEPAKTKAETVSATVEIIFKATSDITTDSVKQTVEKEVKGSSFTEKNLCSKDACDGKTTTCQSGDGSFTCTCLENYIKTDFSDRICIACPSGSKAVNSETCEDCSFGYSGLNCNESWKLILVIVGSVLGGLLLITLILLPLVASKSMKKSSKKNKKADMGEPYVSPSSAKAPLVNGNFANSQVAPVNRSTNAFANASMPRIPRATATNGWESRTNLEMTPSNSRQNLVPTGRNSRLYEDQDDMNPYAQSRPQSSIYGQARPQTNPYAQSRPQINPYASNQGHSNPYYTQDDGRRFN